jgi:hypothetical protein
MWNDPAGLMIRRNLRSGCGDAAARQRDGPVRGATSSVSCWFVAVSHIDTA